MTPDQQKIVDFITEKNKTKFYFKDFLDIFPEKGPREVKKILTSMVQCEVMEFWSSGSTTMSEQYFAMLSPDARDQALAAYPLGIGTPEDVAQTIVFLLSDSGKWITGQTVVMDGGRY